jgi:uncharacterized membrane protein YeiH
MAQRDKSIAFGVGIVFVGVLYIYLFDPAVKAFAESTNEYLEGGAVQLHAYTPPLSILDVVGMTLCCVQYRSETNGQKSWFETAISCFLMQLGGTTLAGMLLGQVPGWMMGDATFYACLLSWWLTFFCPYDLYWRLLQHPAVLTLYNFIAVFSCSHGVTSWGVDKALFNSFHTNAFDISQSFVVCILAGTLANSGGGLICDQLGFTKKKSYTLSDTPPLMRVGNYKSSRGITNSFLMAFLYYTLVNTRKFPATLSLMGLQLPLPITTHALITLLQFYFFSVDLIAPNLDVCQTFSSACLNAVGVSSVVDFSKMRMMEAVRMKVIKAEKVDKVKSKGE